jgi:hypothetical protein
MTSSFKITLGFSVLENLMTVDTDAMVPNFDLVIGELMGLATDANLII